MNGLAPWKGEGGRRGRTRSQYWSQLLAATESRERMIKHRLSRPPTQTLSGLVTQILPQAGKEDCVTSLKNVCAGGYG